VSILPLENKINTQEILEELSSLKLQIIYCDHVNEILKIVFDKKK